MLPHAYGPPAATLLVLGGALSWVAGYRLFRVVLGIYGFILGAMLGSSMMGVSNTTGMIVAALIGGVAGALLLVFAYFIGIALVGAGLGALIAHVGWGHVGGGDPPAGLIVGLALLGSVGALLLQRYVIIVATAFGGAWTALGADRVDRPRVGRPRCATGNHRTQTLTPQSGIANQRSPIAFANQ